jgi:hypothetical protein
VSESYSNARSSGKTLGVPHQVVLDLIDIFFTHAYNAHLLLHKEIFLQEHAAGTVRQHVLLASGLLHPCALAPLFILLGHNSLREIASIATPEATTHENYIGLPVSGQKRQEDLSLAK